MTMISVSCYLFAVYTEISVKSWRSLTGITWNSSFLCCSLPKSCFFLVFLFIVVEIEHNHTSVASIQKDGVNRLSVFKSIDIDKENRSVNHLFKINRSPSKSPSSNRVNLNPAILTSQSSYSINNREMPKGQRCILKNLDVINIPTCGEIRFVDNRDLHLASYSSKILGTFWIGRVLGKGMNGEVRLAQSLETFEKFAIKPLNTKHEIEIIRKLKHPCLLRLVMSVASGDGKLFLLTEFMNAGHLKEALKHAPYEYELHIELKLAMFDVASGLAHLHKMNIAHLDIKAENILAHQHGKETIYKISDFGMSGYDTDLKTKGGTQAYFPPEMFSRKPEVPFSGRKRDMWSMGVLIFTCLFKDYPLTQTELKAQAKFAPTARQFQQFPAEIRHLIKHLLVVDPNKRLTIDEMLGHNWFSDFKIKRRSHRLTKMRREATASLEITLEPSKKHLRVR